jgi:hypothetical protein
MTANEKAARPDSAGENGSKHLQYSTNREDLVNTGVEARKMGDLAAQAETLP